MLRMRDERISGAALISVIVTAYNVQDYLPMCLDSILNQTYPNMEVILIDDGSADESGKICDDYASKDERVVVVHKKNQGIVSARSQGVMLARGDVITFVDGDDWIEADMYRAMMEACEGEKADMVASGLIFDWGSRKKVLLNGIEENAYGKEEVRNKILPQMACCGETKGQGILASVCNKLFKRALLERVMKKIDMGLTLGEDGAIVYCCLAWTEKIMVLNKAWYHYVQREKSMLKTFDFGSFEKIYRLQACLRDGMKEFIDDDMIKGQIDHYVKSMLQSAAESVYGLCLDETPYLFPYESVPKGSRVVLCGAGKVGRSFRECLRRGEYAKVAAWADENYQELRKAGMPVTSLEDALRSDYDYIVIAVNNRGSAKTIRSSLLERDISGDKIIWKIL